MKSKSTNRNPKVRKEMRKGIIKMINQSKDLDELHEVWERIKQYNMYEDEFLMAWYDLRYNLIGKV